MSVRTFLRLAAGFTTAMAAAASTGLMSTAQASPRPTPDPAVITDWNAIAVRTIFAEGQQPPPVAQLYLGFVSTAVYDAVAAIDGRYAPYAKQPRPRPHASSQAAAATAAYQVLSHYFPASAQALSSDYATSLEKIREGAGKTHGIRAGKAAAATIVRLRTGDGRGADVTLNVTPAPGVWRPTPPALAPMLAPWLGFVRPLLLKSPTQIRPAGPDALNSAAYTRDFDEVKAVGVASGGTRTPAQTETARFWNDNLPRQFQTAFRDQAARRHLDIADSARVFAVLNATAADAAIACWRGKYDHAYWRPSTAIQLADTDSNPATAPDPAWSPLIANPPYPDYPSGHACLTGATTAGLSHLFGARHIDLTVDSAVTGTTRHYATADALNQETKDARVWLGIHFRKATTDGNHLGRAVSRWALWHYFRPAGR
ncbi:vanadium-dependent haloperoxidase [Streptomyces sp. NBC_00445]|uniref:vanadium-dependent haloperoxidase n=1 Tax=Streptomyces sp. NBC_00445 TaxID=2975745 RepID=UPI002E1B7B93